MEKINEFDNYLRKINDYNILMFNFCKYIFLTLGCCLMFIPLYDVAMVVCPFSLLIFGMFFYINPFLYIKEGNANISIYKVLKHTPVSKKTYLHHRIKCFFGFWIKIFIISTVFQIIGLILGSKITIKEGLLSVLYVILLFIILFLSGICQILISTRD